MDFDKYRDYPVLGDAIFCKPRRDRYAWVFFGLTVLLTGWMLVDRGAKVALVAGGGLILLSVPNIFPERHYRESVILRVLGIVYYILLWGAIIVFFPDAPTFFEGNW
jgi:hypothetical protein